MKKTDKTSAKLYVHNLRTKELMRTQAITREEASDIAMQEINEGKWNQKINAIKRNLEIKEDFK